MDPARSLVRIGLCLTACIVGPSACEPPTRRDVPDPPSVRGALEPGGILRLGAGDSTRLTFVRIDETAGERTAIVGAAFTSSDPEVATVDADGWVRSAGEGYTRIVARTDSFIDSVWVHRALDEAPPSVLHLEFAPGVSAERRRNAQRAAQRWAELLQDSLATTTLDVPAGGCGLGVTWPTEVRGIERGLRVLVMPTPIAPAAATGICARRESGLPALAFVLLSTDPVNGGIDDAWWDRIFLHEFGHALGLAADFVIPAGGRLASPAMSAGFRHDYGREGVVSYNQHAHWVGVRGDIMDGETGTNAPVIGRTTIGRLLDMGYAVRLRQSGPLDLARMR
jgi:hypothetical protein